jgi:co-chaperonin GroES (HSP10)
VKRTAASSESEGGILLPETCRESLNEAAVLAVGPGYTIPMDNGGCFSTMFCEEGDTVLFPAHCFEQTDAAGEVGIVRDEDLLGMIPAGGDALIPLNDFVMCSVESRRATTGGGLHLADGQKSRPRQGKILDYGPGKIRLKGDYYGTRSNVESILGVTLPMSVTSDEKPLVGKVAIWGVDAEVLEVGSHRAEFLLVRASDILCFLEEDEDGEGDAVHERDEEAQGQEEGQEGCDADGSAVQGGQG